MKNTIIAASIAWSSLAVTGFAQETTDNWIVKKNANWHDAGSWKNGAVPMEEGRAAVINLGRSSVVDEPFDAPINVWIENGSEASPDPNLTINADFQVTGISLASVTGTPCIVEQNAGNVSLKALSLASMSPDSIDATYDLKGGKLETDTINVGLMGPGNLNLKGAGEVVTVRRKLAIGSRASLRFTGGKAGFPTVNAGAEVTIEPGAALTVEAGGPGTKPGKFTLIQADQPLAASFKVELAGFAAGNAKLLESEPGIVLEVK
jgi:hypothetical protein